MLYEFQSNLEDYLAITNNFKKYSQLVKYDNLYKIIWVKSGTITVEIDYQKIELSENNIIALSYLQHISIDEDKGEYFMILFNANFYCIHGNEKELSCQGFLFNGSNSIPKLTLEPKERNKIELVTNQMISEIAIADKYQGEVLRLLLKFFIIQSTRLAQKKLNLSSTNETCFETIKNYFNLVELHFKEKKQVRDYADMLYKSPKTLSNLFAKCNLQSPLKVIHERIVAEAKRLLLYSNKNSKEISDILGFEDQATFSRFFKTQCGVSVTEFKNNSREKM